MVKDFGGVFSTNLGISSSSMLISVGIDDAEEHGVPGVNAGHVHFSVLHSLHKYSLMSCEIVICLKAVSKSRLAQCL